MTAVDLNQKVIKINFSMLERSMDASHISGSLFSEDLITTNVLDQITSLNHTTLQKNGILLRYLLTSRNPDLISKLCKILNEEDANKDIVKALEESYKREQEAATAPRKEQGDFYQQADQPVGLAVQETFSGRKPISYVTNQQYTKLDLYLEYENKVRQKRTIRDEQTILLLLNDRSYQILIEVVNTIEYQAAICQMDGEIRECIVTDSFSNSDSTYYFGKWGNVPVVVVQTGERLGSQFQYGSWFETKKAFYVMPHITNVFGVGVCGAVIEDDKPRVPQGQVVLSSKIVGYDHRKKRPEGDQYRGYEKDLSQTKIYQFFTRKNNINDWDSVVVTGTVLSGSWLVASVEAQKLIISDHRDDKAFEMEGVGIAAACQNVGRDIECLVVKGVSDYANSNKNDDWQPAAAKNAVCFLSEMLNAKNEKDGAKVTM